MKNKEIEELLNYMKQKQYIFETNINFGYKTLSAGQVDLLLSYIEQLENNRDKAIEYVEEKGRLKYNPNELIDILKGDSDES